MKSIKKLCSVERDRVTAAEICIDEMLTIMDRHGERGSLYSTLRTSCPPDGIVGDMFAGSGAAGEAAMHAGRRYAGCEIDVDMAQKANDRLAGMLHFPVGEGKVT
jgi:hypothetical protein